jgi:hypothetical protein
MYRLGVSYRLIIFILILNDIVCSCYGTDSNRKGSKSKRRSTNVVIPQVSEDEHERQILSSLFQDEFSSSSSSSQHYKRKKGGSKSSFKRTKRRRSKANVTSESSNNQINKRNRKQPRKALPSKTEIITNTTQIQTPDHTVKEIPTHSVLNLKREIDILRNMTRVDLNLTAEGPKSPRQSTEPENSKPYEKRPATTMSLTTPWARKFIMSRPKDALLPIPREYLSDGFNLVNIAPVIQKMFHENKTDTQATTSIYKSAIKLILEEEGMMNSTSVTKDIQHAAEVIYQLVHARFVCSPRGLDTIRRMFKRNADSGTICPIFGRCSRIKCNGSALLPFGVSDQYDISGKGSIHRKAMRYCCSCREVSKIIYHFWIV